ncbi:MAG: excinuclease ABC subunit UvrA [Gemmatimonadetes bacterium]|nr:excinuclease ABC subunit UvrA [Gemmatimonadota bacterium]
MASDCIVVRNARQHNLKGITVEFPRRQLTVVTGPSGSGKSSLAFDTLYAEGYRRYVESLSTYAKQFLDRLPKPLVDHLEGISPAVAIEQKNPTTSSRSTVGTATEIYDYLRLLWSRIGQPRCVECGGAIVSDTPATATDKVLAEWQGKQLLLAFPLPRSEFPDHDLILENLMAMGFVRILAGHAVHRLDGLPSEIRLDTADVSVVVDRVKATIALRSRVADSLAQAFTEGDGMAAAVTDGDRMNFSLHPRCSACGASGTSISPTLFSFNNPRGACPTCNGFGAVLEYHTSLIVPDEERTLAEGAIDPWTKPRYVTRRRLLRDVAKKHHIAFDRPWRRLPARHRELLLEGGLGHFQGVLPFLRALEGKRYKQYIRVFLRRYQLAITCSACNGKRLRPEALAVEVGGHSIADVTAGSAGDMLAWLEALDLTPFERDVASTILPELHARITYLCDVGLGYLTLNRQTRTLSAGEAQRIALANALGANLVDTLYVLDEPSIGLHPYDIDRLMKLLIRLRDAGNTVVVVEHDLAAIAAADFMVELGPAGGTNGGELVYAGPASEAYAADTLTGQYLSGIKAIRVPSARRHAGPRWLSVKGATLHNLRGVDAAFPLGTLIAVTGVSGSGKSTLVHDVLYRQLASRLRGGHGAKEHLGEQVGSVEELSGWEELSDVVLMDQSPIGRSPRSNPITYVKGFDEIRQLFASQPVARARGYTATTFSFNASRGGRCSACEGAGFVRIEMVFLADVFVPCEICGGTRYDREVLDVRIKGLSIYDVLQLTVDEAIERFRHQAKLGKTLWHLQQVGLGYLRLGQPATTLSGGEAQRLKIARQLAGVARKKDRRLYILDEPTTGLHLDDVLTLLRVLDRLVDAGHTVIVIEHHLDVIKRADWIVDLGPDGGEAGGRVVAEGTPEQVARTSTHTGRFLARALAQSPAATASGASTS